VFLKIWLEHFKLSLVFVYILIDFAKTCAFLAIFSHKFSHLQILLKTNTTIPLMETNSFDWKNKKDRDDFIIAILVLAFFGWLIYQFGFNRYVDNPIANITQITEIETENGTVIIEDIDSDNDGVVDRLDQCPQEAGFSMYNGCPSEADLKTAAIVAAPAIVAVAPQDTDSDGVSDANDKCPTEKGIRPSGCPDSDGDGVIDKNDKCPTVAGLADRDGCPAVKDTDGDGVEDSKDKCPTQKGVRPSGCPDKDGDGVEDRKDKCPTVKGLAKFQGCPDTDNDGVIDSKDKCPNKAGTAANNGCPEVQLEESEKKLIEEAIKNVEFRTGSAQLKNTSASILTQLAGLMKKYPDYKLTISGHTDNDGKSESNLILSEKRAISCLNFLKTKGVAESRMNARGFGDSQPKASNNTPAGKRQNRRVEFKLEY